MEPGTAGADLLWEARYLFQFPSHFFRMPQGKLPALGETYSCPTKLTSVGKVVTILALPRPFWGTITLMFYCFWAIFTFIQVMGEHSTYIHTIAAFKIRSVIIPRQFYTGKRIEIPCYGKNSPLTEKVQPRQGLSMESHQGIVNSRLTEGLGSLPHSQGTMQNLTEDQFLPYC